MNPFVKLILAVLLLLCLADMPYGYFLLVRFVASACFVYMAYGYFKNNSNGLGFTFAALAVLFQPFIKIALGRVLWNVVDVAIAALLIYLVVLYWKQR